MFQSHVEVNISDMLLHLFFSWEELLVAAHLSVQEEYMYCKFCLYDCVVCYIEVS